MTLCLNLNWTTSLDDQLIWELFYKGWKLPNAFFEWHHLFPLSCESKAVIENTLVVKERAAASLTLGPKDTNLKAHSTVNKSVKTKLKMLRMSVKYSGAPCHCNEHHIILIYCVFILCHLLTFNISSIVLPTINNMNLKNRTMML